MDTISASLAAAIKAQKKKMRKLRRIRAMVAFLDRRRHNIAVEVERRGRM
jgi:hypothetical protein